MKAFAVSTTDKHQTNFKQHAVYTSELKATVACQMLADDEWFEAYDAYITNYQQELDKLDSKIAEARQRWASAATLPTKKEEWSEQDDVLERNSLFTLLSNLEAGPTVEYPRNEPDYKYYHETVTMALPAQVSMADMKRESNLYRYGMTYQEVPHIASGRPVPPQKASEYRPLPPADLVMLLIGLNGKRYYVNTTNLYTN